MGENTGSFRSEQSESFFDGFVNLQVRSPANRISGRFPIDILLEIDEFIISVEPTPSLIDRIAQKFSLPVEKEFSPIKLVVRLRHCTVRYAESGVSVISETKYRSPIEVGKYQESSLVYEEEGQQSQFSRNSSAKFNANPARLTGGLEASVGGGQDWHGANRAESEILVVKDLYEVEAIPGGWRVGDRMLGDPLKRGGCLNGPYFNRPSPTHPNSCELEFVEGLNLGSLTFLVSSDDGLRVERRDGLAVTRNDIEAADRKMRERLASIRIERGLSPRNVLGGRAEIPLFAVLCQCEKGEDVSVNEMPAQPLPRANSSQIESQPVRAIKPSDKSGGLE